MTTITRERLEQIANFHNQMALPPSHAEIEELAPLTIQCWSCRDEIEVSAICDCDGYCPKCNSPIDLNEEPYTAPPAPVSVPDALPENDDEEGNDIDYMEPSEIYALGRTAGWNACRAAMLNGGKS